MERERLDDTAASVQAAPDTKAGGPGMCAECGGTGRVGPESCDVCDGTGAVDDAVDRG